MKIGIVGAGMVGSAIMGDLLAQATISEIVLVDIDRDKSEGEVLDYSHTTSYNYNPSANLKAGDYSHLNNSDIIIITAGASIKKGETRRDLAVKNSKIICDVMEQITKYTTDALIIMVSNPVDIATYIAQEHVGYPKDKIIGSGTLVDSARLMKIIGDKYSIDPKNVFAYILGEHGAGSFATWSIANICGYDFETFAKIKDLDLVLDKEEVENKVKEIGFNIWRKKGYTNHGISAGVVRLVKAISLNENSVLPVSVVLQGEYGLEDVALSVPCIVGEDGIEKVLEFELSEPEKKKLKASADSLQDIILALKS